MVESATASSTSPPKCCTLKSASVSSCYSLLTMLAVTTPLSGCTVENCSPDATIPAATILATAATLAATATLTSIPSPTSEVDTFHSLPFYCGESSPHHAHPHAPRPPPHVCFTVVVLQ